ncbi:MULTISPECIES: hypothetical protein [unclassified Phaeobacter]|uniref:hypothetical protein n=1 Tax=unclassified Phaeobacter TaxID=2621772 RepID=UPI003A88F764
MGLFSTIIGAVAGPLIGGGFSRRGQKKQDARNDTQLQRLVADATAAGINPLTAVRSGGAPSYTSQGPALSSSSFFAEALGKGIETAFNHKQAKRDEERDKLELDIMREELKEIRKTGSVAFRENFGYSIPSANTYTGVTDAGTQGPRLDNSGTVPARDGSRGSGNRVAGITISEDDRWSDAEDIEQRYGDVASSAYGVSVAGADALETAKLSPMGRKWSDRRKQALSNIEERNRIRPKSRPVMRPTLSAPPMSGPTMSGARWFMDDPYARQVF